MNHDHPLDVLQAALVQHDWDWAVRYTDDPSGTGCVRRRKWPKGIHIQRGGMPLFKMKDGQVIDKRYPGHCKVNPNSAILGLIRSTWKPTDEDKGRNRLGNLPKLNANVPLEILDAAAVHTPATMGGRAKVGEVWRFSRGTGRVFCKQLLVGVCDVQWADGPRQHPWEKNHFGRESEPNAGIGDLVGRSRVKPRRETHNLHLVHFVTSLRLRTPASDES